MSAHALGSHALGGHALASQDVAALTAFSARKKMPEGGGQDSGEGFDAALAQSETETPPQKGSTASGAGLASSSVKEADAANERAPVDFTHDGASWRDLPGLAGAKAAGIRSAASADITPKDGIVPTTQAKTPALDSFAKLLASSAAADAPPDRKYETSLAQPTEPRVFMPSLSQKVEPVPVASAVPRAPPAKTSAAPKRTPAASDGETASVVTSATSAKTTGPADTTDASFVAASSSPQAQAAASGPEGPAFSAPTGSATERESVARIGVALASTRWPASAPGVAEKSSDDPGIHVAAPQAAAKSAVHVVAQKAWLQPVSPVFIPGLDYDRAAADSPHAAARILVPEVVAPAPGQSPASTSTAPAGVAGLGETAIDPFEDSDSALTAPAAAPGNSNAIPLAAPPRRDLEITMAPKDLGGLAVRMKSAGDRLEIGFVADRGETARMISDKSAALESQLQGAGLGLGGIDIAAACKSESGAAGWTPSDGGASANGAEADSGGNSQTAPQRQEFSGRDKQDKSYDGDQRTSEPRVPGGAGGLYL